MSRSVSGVSRLKARLKASCLGTGWLSKSVKLRRVKPSLMRSRSSIVPVLVAHENERAKHLRGSDAVASGAGVLQASLQILAHLLDEGEVLIEELGDGLEDGIEMDTLELQFEVGESELGRERSHRSEFLSGRRRWWLSSQMRSKVALILR